jgi:RNA polymerase sigma-70 factor (ECF subfamily)
METVAADEGELLTLARTGDEGAFSALVETHRAELRSYCYRMLGSAQDAEDAVQDAMLRAWRGLGAFEGRGSVRSWLYTIATRTTIDLVRHRSRRELPANFGPAGTAGEAVEDAVLDPVWLQPYPDQWLASASGRGSGAAVIDVLTLSPADGKISAVTAFVLLDEQSDPAATFTRFGLPAAAPPR